jgi:hypothetical protein
MWESGFVQRGLHSSLFLAFELLLLVVLSLWPLLEGLALFLDFLSCSDFALLLIEPFLSLFFCFEA